MSDHDEDDRLSLPLSRRQFEKLSAVLTTGMRSAGALLALSDAKRAALAGGSLRDAATAATYAMNARTSVHSFRLVADLIEQAANLVDDAIAARPDREEVLAEVGKRTAS